VVETSFEGVQSDVNLTVLEEIRGIEDAVAGRADALSDTVSLQDTSEMEAGWGLLTGLDVLPEQGFVLPGLKIWELLELE